MRLSLQPLHSAPTPQVSSRLLGPQFVVYMARCIPQCLMRVSPNGLRVQQASCSGRQHGRAPPPLQRALQQPPARDAAASQAASRPTSTLQRPHMTRCVLQQGGITADIRHHMPSDDNVAM